MVKSAVSKCEWCAIEFTPKRAGRDRFCGRRCGCLDRESRRRELPSKTIEMTTCQCGCTQPMPKYDSHGRVRRNLYRHNPKSRPDRTCLGCQVVFNKRGGGPYCSRACSGAMRRQAKIATACETCGTSYECFPYLAGTSRYCSKACWSDRCETGACRHCGGAFKRRSGGAKIYCSRACAHAHMVGPLAAAWRDGKSLKRDRLRLQPQVRVWRCHVFERDGFACRLCGTTGYLHAHHIKEWATHPDLRFDVDNGLTLCVDCHSEVHGRRIGDRARHRDRSAHDAPSTSLVGASPT